MSELQELQELRAQGAELAKKFDQIQRCGLSGGQLRAQSISVMCSTRRECNAGCAFCISRITPGSEEKNGSVQLLDIARLEVGLDFAKRCGATHAILTGKADPLQENPFYLTNLLRTCRSRMPVVDMHTNGIGLFKHEIKDLVASGLNMITLSIASFDENVNYGLMKHRKSPAELLARISKEKLLKRCSLVLNKSGVSDFAGVQTYIENARELGAHQVVIRELWLPDVLKPLHSEVDKWNKDNFIDVSAIANEFAEQSRQQGTAIKFVRFLPWGTPVYDAFGLNVTFARCEESFNGGTLKSIVHKSDFGYMDWNSNSIIY